MQTDILASAVRTSDGVMNDQAGNAIGRCRVKAIYIAPAAGAGLCRHHRCSICDGVLWLRPLHGRGKRARTLLAA